MLTELKIYFSLICISLAGLFNAEQCYAVEAGIEQYKFMHVDINDGLSNNQVRAILKDSQGFMWFGTDRGLTRYDGTNFKIYLNSLFDSTSIPFNSIDFLFEDPDKNIWIRSSNDFAIYNPVFESFTRVGNQYKNTSVPVNSLQNLYKDKDENLWFICRDYGLYKYSPESGKVDSIPYNPEPDNLNTGYFNDLKEDSKGNLWAVTSLGEIRKIDPKSYKILRTFQLQGIESSEIYGLNIFIDKDDDLWVYGPGNTKGVFYLNSASGEIENYTDASNTIQLNNNLVSSVEQDESGKIWLATDHGGINILDKKNKTVSVLTANSDNRYSISQNSVTYLYKDAENIIWAGTYKKGINYYHKNLVRFKHYSHIPSAKNGLPYNDVNCFAEDNKGNLYIGTNGGGLIYFNRKNNTYKRFLHDPNKPNSLSNNIIVSLYIDRNNLLWIGTYTGGLNRYNGQHFKVYRHNAEDASSLSDDRVWEIYEDSKQNLWIGTLNGGLNLFDREKEEFYHYKAEDINSVGSNFVVSIIEDSKKNLWIGTAGGLNRLDLETKRFYHYAPEPGTKGKLSNKNAIDLLEDSRGWIWIATHQGLNVLGRNESQFRVFTENDGLASSNIKTIQEDQQGNIWISTTNGLSKLSVVNSEQNPSIEDIKMEVKNFNTLDGLQGKEFNEKAAYRTRSGELIFGGANGFNLFIPEDIKKQPGKNKIVLTGFKVFNQTVGVNTPVRNRVILDKSITLEDQITLRHNENVFSIEFASLNFFQPEKNLFEYRLEGFNEEWLKADQRLNEITFTNLNAGTYHLHIRVSNDGSQWREMEPPLEIVVLPSFWQSTAAYFMYFILLGFAIWVVRRIMLERHRLKYEAEQEHREAERIQQLDALKTKFFTNISHEFRTPLSLIISPLGKLVELAKDEDTKNHLILIQRNARRLLAMVNQLLDFRKLEVQQVEAKNSWGEMISFIREVALSFEDLAQNKQITFNFKSSVKELYTYFDHDKTEKIISNLLSNAFKFTPQNGKVSLRIDWGEKNENTKNATIQWQVQDTGIGIAPDMQTKIFDRFYQSDVPSSIINQGTGIGLSMVNEYVNILGGSIKVESIVGKGSSFIVQVPVKLFNREETDERNRDKKPEKPVESFRIKNTMPAKRQEYDKQKKTILLVEDNNDFRFYLKDNLQNFYNILEAGDGTEGWEIVQQYFPDLVVTDIMMPNTDGISLCSMIKNNRKTKHIPVILLTAKTDAEPVIEGFDSGADDYIAKPFDFRILESRIENLINTREQLKLSYQSMIGITPEKIDVKSQDEKFIKKALEVVESYLSEASFSVEDFGVEMGMSRVSLYKKILALTNKTPIEFIRIIRLKRAADLLTSSKLSVSEVAYKVGFNNPRYFSKYFSEEFDMLPSEYIAKHRNPNIEISDETKEKYN